MGACSRGLTLSLSLWCATQALGQGLAVNVQVVRDAAGQRSVEVSNDSPVPVRVRVQGAPATTTGTIVLPSEVVRSPLPPSAPRSLAWSAEPETRAPAPAAYLLPFIGVARVTQLPVCLSSHSRALRHAIDFAIPTGTPVRAARDGTVLTLADGSTGPGSFEPSHQVQVLHADGTWAVYGHLQASSHLVVPGQFVQAGELLAYSGNSGDSSGPHLHFAVHYLRNGVPDTLPVTFTKSLHCGMSISQD